MRRCPLPAARRRALEGQLSRMQLEPDVRDRDAIHDDAAERRGSAVATYAVLIMYEPMGSSPTWFLYPQGQLPKALGSFPTAFLLTPNHIKMGSLPVPFLPSPGMCLSLKILQWPSCQPKFFSHTLSQSKTC